MFTRVVIGACGLLIAAYLGTAATVGQSLGHFTDELQQLTSVGGSR